MKKILFYLLFTFLLVIFDTNQEIIFFINEIYNINLSRDYGLLLCLIVLLIFGVAFIIKWIEP